MMPLVSSGWNAVVFVLSLLGFFFLALANAREGKRLLRRPVGQGERRICAGAGSVLLLLALWVCIQEWRGNFGPVLWFGWLTVAALALVFALAGGGRDKTTNVSPTAGKEADRRVPPPSARSHPRAGRGFAWGIFFLASLLFLSALWLADPWPVLREDAIRGEAGPWAFTLSEAEDAPPKVGGSGVAMKEFALRFADAALPEIRAAYLRARQPRSLKAAGIAFEGNHLRTTAIVIPPAFEAKEGIWLTVEGRNGEVHHAAVEVARLSPALARFLAGEAAARESGEGWDPTLSCWNEAEEVVCQGARFGDGADGGMDGAAIEVFGGNGEVFLSARLNRKGQIRFPRPGEAFHVLMEEGPGRTVELDWRDVAASAGREGTGR
jgi:hypothetical protein